MQVTIESMENFKRAIQFDALLGILDTTSGNIYLALASPRGIAPEITVERRSYVGGEKKLPYGAGGHGALATDVGLSGHQSAPIAIGFSIIKLGVNKYEIGTTCSSLNIRFDHTDFPRSEPFPRSQLVPESSSPESGLRAAPDYYLGQIVDCLNAAIGQIK